MRPRSKTVKVTLRFKMLNTGKETLYLDYYPPIRNDETAYKYGYLPKDLNADLKSIKEIETQREFLTLDELRRLVDTPCNDDVLKRAALFSALTGLRHSDIKKMKWGEITVIDGKYTLRYTIQKTSKYQELPISEQAVSLCGERKSPNSLVFEELIYSAYANKALAQWIGVAGITRNITFHCFRHTFATLQYDKDYGRIYI